MKFMIPLIAATLALGACSQRDMCLRDATRSLRTLTALTEETRANIARGFAIGERDKVIERHRSCTVTQPDGSTIRQLCTDIETVTEEFPVAIDLNAERAKLRSLEERLTEERRRANAARQSCIATYPE